MLVDGGMGTLKRSWIRYRHRTAHSTASRTTFVVIDLLALTVATNPMRTPESNSLVDDYSR
jgi:hypothetical protein